MRTDKGGSEELKMLPSLSAKEPGDTKYNVLQAHLAKCKVGCRSLESAGRKRGVASQTRSLQKQVSRRNGTEVLTIWALTRHSLVAIPTLSPSVSCMNAASKQVLPPRYKWVWGKVGVCLYICRGKFSAQHRLTLALEMNLIKFPSATCLGADARPLESGVWRKESVCCWQTRTERVKRWADEHKIHRPRAAAAWQHSPG